jgi:small subunit ribosomal protein S13
MVKMGVTKPKDESKEKPKEEEKKVEKSIKPKKEEMVTIIRVAGTDLNGEKPLIRAINKIRGISYTTSKAICKVGGFDPKVKLSQLSEKDREKLEKIIKTPYKFGIPIFLINRRRDRETGEDLHLTGADLDIARKFDIKRYVDLKTYRGWRHMFGQPVRGQRTRSSFRERGKSVGVVRKQVQAQMGKPAEKKEEKK